MASQIPPGIDLTASRAPNIIAAVTVLWIAGLAFAGLRLFSRRVSKLALGWDDWLCIFALIPFSASNIANYVGVYYGAGQHLIVIVEKHPTNIQKFLEYIYAVEILYPFIIAPIKCSICCLYLRLFRVHKSFRLYCFGLIVLTILWSIGLLFGSIFQCTPVKDAWNKTGDRSNCVDLRTFLVGFNVPNIAIDFLILIAPIYPIWTLHLPSKRKTLIIIILMLGAGEVAFSIVRLARLISLNTADSTWDYFDAIVWSTVEQSIGIICICLPVVGPLLPRSIMGLGSTSSHNADKYKRYHHSDNPYPMHAMGRKTFSQLDNESTTGVSGDNIRQTTEIRVDFHSARN